MRSRRSLPLVVDKDDQEEGTARPSPLGRTSGARSIRVRLVKKPEMPMLLLLVVPLRRRNDGDESPT